MKVARLRQQLGTYIRYSRRMASFELDNPLLSKWNTPYGLPPFQNISPNHYTSAILEAMPLHIRELESIADNKESPTFDNTISAFDKAGGTLTRILQVYYNQCSSNSPPELMKVQSELSAPLAEHDNNVITHPGLFHRVDLVHENRFDLQLSPEQIRLTERIHLQFIRAGAKLTPEAQQRHKEISMELAQLMTEFSQNILLDESTFSLPLETPQDLAGLPADVVAACQQAATERGLPPGSHILTLSRSLVEPFLTFSESRQLRRDVWTAWTRRY